MSNVPGIYAGLVLVTAPTQEPISLEDAKTHLRIEDSFTDDDTYISTLITLGRQQVEGAMHRALLTQTWNLFLQNWPGRDYNNWPSSLTVSPEQYWKYNHIKLPRPPLQSVTSVTYMDSSGVTWTMQNAAFSGSANTNNSYNVVTAFEPGRIVLPYSGIWPTNILMPGAPIQIQFVGGYQDVPTLQSSFEGFAASLHAIKRMLAYCYENRVPPSEMRKSMQAAGLDMVVDELLTPYRIFE